MSLSCIKYAFMTEKNFGVYTPKSIEYKHRKNCMEFLSRLFIAVGCLYLILAGLLYGSNMESIHIWNCVSILGAGIFWQIMALYFNAMQFKHLEQEMKKEKTPKTS